MGLAGFVLVVSRTEQVSGRDRRNGKRYGAVSMGVGIGGGGGRRSWSVYVREKVVFVATDMDVELALAARSVSEWRWEWCRIRTAMRGRVSERAAQARQGTPRRQPIKRQWSRWSLGSLVRP